MALKKSPWGMDRAVLGRRRGRRVTAEVKRGFLLGKRLMRTASSLLRRDIREVGDPRGEDATFPSWGRKSRRDTVD